MSTQLIMRTLPSGNRLVHVIFDNPEWDDRYAFRTTNPINDTMTDHTITKAEYDALLPLTDTNGMSVVEQ